MSSIVKISFLPEYGALVRAVDSYGWHIVEDRTRIVLALFLINRTKRREKKYLFGSIVVGLAKDEEEMSQKRSQIDNDAFLFGTHSGILY